MVDEMSKSKGSPHHATGMGGHALKGWTGRCKSMLNNASGDQLDRKLPLYYGNEGRD